MRVWLVLRVNVPRATLLALEIFLDFSAGFHSKHNARERPKSAAENQTHTQAFELSTDALRANMRCAHIHRAHTTGSGCACARFRHVHALWHAEKFAEAVAR